MTVYLKYEARKLCILANNNSINLHTSRLFRRCRGSNAINNNNEPFLKMFRPMFSICSLLEVKIRRCILMCLTSLLSRIQSNVSQRATLLLSKLHAWINKLDGRGMLSVNQLLKIRCESFHRGESLTPKTSRFKKKTLSST